MGLLAVCLETRHVRAAMSAQRKKTDKADALGIAISCALAGSAMPINAEFDFINNIVGPEIPSI